MGKKDLTGQRFNRLTVIKRNGSNKHKKALWLCKCDCGNEVSVTTGDLNSGHTQSCGCLQKERASEVAIKDLTGQRFGRLTVIKDNGRANDGKVKWLCKCDCGNEVSIISKSLQNGETQSCGCLQKERASANFKQLRNEWEQDDNYKQMLSEKAKTQWQDEEFRNRMSGENHPNYDSSITDKEREEMKKHRKSDSKFQKWSKEVKEQANFTCDCCGKCGYELHSHHLNGWNKFKEQRYDLSNGVCLCEHCHKEFHKLYGKGDNTKEQYIEFKNNKLTK